MPHDPRRRAIRRRFGHNDPVVDHDRPATSVPDLDLDLGRVLEALPDGVVVIDSLATIVWVNARFRKLTGWTNEEVVGRNGLELMDPDKLADAIEALNITNDQPEALPPGAYGLAHKDGGYVTLELHAAPIDPTDPNSLIAMMARPIEYQFMMNEGIELLNAGGPIQDMATYIVDVIGWPAGSVAVAFDDDATGDRRSIRGALDPLLDGTGEVDDGTTPWAEAEASGEAVFRLVDELPPSLGAVARASGFIACTAEPVPDPSGRDAVIVLWFDEGASTTYRFLFREEPRYLLLRLALERRHYLRTLRNAATKDHLTGLANRAHFFESLERAETHEACAVLYIDLDDFKPINDTLGHFIGDAVLAEIGLRLRGATRPGDLVARLGGDEFAVFCPQEADADAAEAFAARLHHAVTLPIEMPGGPIRVGATIGMAVAAKPGIPPVQLLETADRMLYELKRLGKDGWRSQVVT